MHPLDRFHEDHLAFRERFSAFESRLDGVVNARRLDAPALGALQDDLRFTRDRLLPHFHAEDETVLPAMESRLGRHGASLVGILAYEHEELRRAVRKLEQAIGTVNLDELNRHGLFLVQVLQDHVRKEEATFFPSARKTLGTQEWDDIEARLDALGFGGESRPAP